MYWGKKQSNKMNSEFSQYLYKYFSINGSIALPGLGMLSLIRVPSTNDFANKVFYSPIFRFHFEQSIETTDELLNIYLKSRLNISDKELDKLYEDFSIQSNQQLEANGKVEWEGIGFFSYNDAKKIEFTPHQEIESLSDKIAYEHVVREAYSHDVLTGDKMQTSDELHQYFEDQRRGAAWQGWKIASVVFISIAVASIVVRFFLGNFSMLDARYDHVPLHETETTYTLIK
jgi:hypothetical protein